MAIKSFGGPIAAAGATWAAGIGQALAYTGERYNLPLGVTEISREVHGLHMLIFWVCVAIAVVVFGAMFYSVFAHRRSVHPKPADFHESTTVEIIWTTIPFIILIAMAIPAAGTLLKMEDTRNADLTIKVTGYQWYWGYEYIGEDLAYDGYMIGSPFTGGDNRMSADVEAQLIEAGYRKEDFLLATDTAVVVPVGKTVVMQVTGADVIHSWTIPAFGVKQDAVPGRLAEPWFTAEKEGVYFGQCSELCGLAHAYMPITVKVVSEATYDAWLEASKNEGGYVDVRTLLTN